MDQAAATMDLAAQPVRSLLFSGGVFRGVYQMGVVNALNQLDLKPDLIAGASVGSITAAMTASMFGQTTAARDELVLRLAAVYLAIDRLVLTDRFADFVRNLTVRSADARFSVYQADRVFRAFDADGLRPYAKDVRTVLAGLERLLYVSPFEVADFARAVRDRSREKVSRLINAHVREWLERMEVGDEVLGSAPLQRLIDEYVTRSIDRDSWRYDHAPAFDAFRTASGIQFLATTTNLTQGRLEILGLRPEIGFEGRPACLPEGLLASSAFPGVFRPREAHEVFPGTSSRDQYIDGGVIDNLPLDAVAEFLVAASPTDNPLLHRRPVGATPNGTYARRPHLMFSASLEVRTDRLEVDPEEISWLELSSVTKKLGYNRKLDTYDRTQTALRDLFDRWDDKQRSAPADPDHLEPLDIQMVVVKPEWLCSTFGFHPMLGFRRERQAQSIAHGCATTLLEVGRLNAEQKEQVRAWGVEEKWIPKATSLREAFADLDKRGRRRGREEVKEGLCWLVDEKVCPFSHIGTRPGNGEGDGNRPVLPEATRKELNEIYLACRNRRSHGVKRNGSGGTS